MDTKKSAIFDKQTPKNDKIKLIPQFLAGFAANLAAMVTGTVIAWTSPSLPILEGPNSPIPITKNENSWISSLMPLGAVFGPFVAGRLADKCGRKKGLLISAIPSIVSWIALAVGRSVAVIYAARFLAGFAVGWIFTLIPVYCGEIADKSIRGAILSLTQIFIVFGLLFDYCIGPYVPYRWLSIGAAFVPLAFFILFALMPESPSYYFSIGRKDLAEKSLRRLRSQYQEEYYEIFETQADIKKKKKENILPKDLFATRGSTKAFIISLSLMAFQQFSGINIVLFHSQSIFDKAGGSLKPEESTIIIGCIMLVGSSTTPLVVDRWGRKMLLLISATGMAISHAILGTYFYLEKAGHDVSAVNFLPLIAVITYIIIYSIGFGPLPWALMGEMFNSNIKAQASTLTASFCWLLAFLVTRFFNDVVDALGDGFTFWIFGFCCIIAIFFVNFVLPETKNKSFAEIQKLLNGAS